MMQWARRALKAPLAASGAARQAISATQDDRGVIFLIYHRTEGTLGLELDLDAGLFARQVAYLAATGKVIGYEQAVARLARAERDRNPAYVLTFDDGYEDFYTRVFPLLQEHRLPALLFVGELSYGDVVDVLRGNHCHFTRPERLLADSLIDYLQFKRSTLSDGPQSKQTEMDFPS